MLGKRPQVAIELGVPVGKSGAIGNVLDLVYEAAANTSGIDFLQSNEIIVAHYVGYAPQLFDLNADPTEENDLGESPDHAEIRAECEARLRDILDPEAVNDQAFADQARRAEELGGAAAIRARGDFSYTPAPGEAAVFHAEGDIIGV